MVKKIRVLYVDDEPALLDLCKMFLERSGDFTVTTAPGAPEAIRILAQERFDVIVSDYQMPEMNGIEFLKHLKVLEDTTPFIIFTGKGREDVVIEALNAGADFYIQKGGGPEAQFAELAHKIKKGVEGRRTKRAFVDSEEKYRRIVDTADEGIGLLDDHFRITYANRRMAEMLGYTLEEMIGKEISSFMPTGELADYSVRTKLQREGVHDHFERQFLRKDGSTLWTSVSITPIADANGNFTGSVTMYSDITERKHAEEALHTKERQLSSIFNNVSESLFLLSVEPDLRFRFISINQNFLNATGLSEDQVAGRYVDEVIPEPSLTLVLENYKQAIREKKIVRWFEVTPYPSGTKYGHVAVTPIYDGNGHCTNLIGSVHDITELKLAEEELRISEEKFRNVFDWANDAILLHTFTTDEAPGRFIDANLVACRMLGYSREELLSMGPPDIVPPEIRPQLGDIIRQAQKKETVLFETMLRRKDGTTFPAESSGHHVNYDGRRIWISHIRDITERKRAEEALQITNEKYTKAFISVPDAITISELDSGRFIEVNDAATRIFGYSRDELIGKSAVELGIWLDNEERDHFIDLIRKHGKVSQFEVLERRKSGELYNALVNADTISLGNVPCLISIVHDITARKRVEQTLRESEERYRSLAESSPDQIFIIGRDDTLQYVNPQAVKLFNLPRDQILGKSRTSLFPPEIAIAQGVLLRKVFETGEPLRQEETIRFGTVMLWIDTRFVPLKDERGNVLSVLGVSRDVTERKQDEESLKLSRMQLAEAMDLANLVNWEFDVASGIFTFNDRFYALYGTTAEREGGYQMPAEVYAREFVHPDEVYLVADEVRKAITSTDPDYTSHSEHRIIRRDGEIRHIIVRYGITKDAEGRTVKTHGANQDITERKQAEEALRKSEEKFQSLYMHMIEGAALHELRYNDEGIPDDYVIVETNPAFEKQLGISRNSVIGKTSREAYGVTEPPYLEIYARVALTGEPEIFEAYFPQIAKHLSISAFCPHKGSFATIFEDITERRRAEDALRESEERYREFFMISRDSVFITSPDGRFIDFNDALVEMFGFESRKEMSLVPVNSIYAHPEERAAFTRHIEREGYVKEYPILLRKKDGTVIDTIITTVPVRNPDGSLKAFVGTIRDVTEQKRVEQEIRTLLQFQESIVDNANVWISVLDTRGTILVWNTAAEQISGYPGKDVIGKNTVWKQLYPDPLYRKQVAENILDIIKKNTYLENFETRIRTVVGDEKIIWWNTQPLRDASGKPVQFIAIGRDNTSRKRSEEKLRALRQFEESIIKNANIWISVLDGKGNVSVWNRAAEEISGYGADEVIGRNTIWSRMYPDTDYRRSVTAKIKEVIGAGRYLENFETRIRTKGGQQRIIWWNTRVLHDVPGIDDTFIAIGRDVTEQKTLQDAVQLANRKLNLLSSITRHDILNQLMVLKGYLELSREAVGNPTALIEYIKKEETAAIAIQDQITFTRDYQELGVAAPEWQHMNASIEKALTGLQIRDVRVEVYRSDLEIFADLLLEKVFNNLMDNALRYGGDTMKTIRVSAEESDRGLTIVCEDDGVGITDEDKKHLFTRGFGKNTGLGLFLSREILSITGITITENGKPGKGARFEITVPKGIYRFR